MLNTVSQEVLEMVANYKFNRKVFKGVNYLKVDGFTANTVTIMGVEVQMNEGEWRLHGVTEGWNSRNDSTQEQFYTIMMLPNFQRVRAIEQAVFAGNEGKGIAVGKRFSYSGNCWLDEEGKPMNEAKWAEYKAWKAAQQEA